MLQVRMQDNEVIEAREAKTSLEDSRVKFVVLDEHGGGPAKHVAQEGHALQSQLQDRRQEKLANAPEYLKNAVQMEHSQTQGSDHARFFAGELRSASLERITRAFHQRVNIFIAEHQERLEQIGAWVVIITAIITSALICGCYSWNIHRSEDSRQTQQRTTQSARTSLTSGHMDGVVPLCPHLVVPDKKRLSCTVENVLRRKKQDLNFAIMNAHKCPVFQVVVSELSAMNKPGIFLKNSNGSTLHGFISTQDLWSGSGSDRPTFEIYDAAGELHSTLRKNSSTEGVHGSYYELTREQRNFMRLSGDFLHNSFSVFLPRGPPTEHQPHGQVVATAQPTDLGVYTLRVHAHVDAAIIILSMLGVSKLENDQPD